MVIIPLTNKYLLMEKVMKDGYGIGKIAWSGKSSEGIGYAKEGWDG